MTETAPNTNKPAAKSWIALFIIIALQILCFVLTFAFQKQVFYEDEFFSYALANSSGRPFLYGSKVQVPDNINSWETGDSFRYYISVSDETAFDYANVWSNQAGDFHPPLYYVFIHTISSFFPNQFSWWWGFILNLFFFAVTQIYLFLLSRRLAKSDFTGLAVCFCYGFSLAGLNTVIFVRMYTMLTMFVVMLVYYGCKAADAEKLTFRSHLLPIALTVLGGALTQHLFLLLAFVFTALHCIIELIKKRFRPMFGFGLAAAAGVALSFAIFPTTLAHFRMKYHYSGEPSYDVQSYLLERLLISETTGYTPPFFPGNTMTYIKTGLILLIAFSLPVLFLFRNELKLKERLPEFARKVYHSNFTWVPALCTCFALFYYTAATVFYLDFEQYCDRYLFPMFPILIAFVICTVMRLFSLIGLKGLRISAKAVVCIALAGLLLYQNLFGYREQYVCKACVTGDGPINTHLVDADCVLIVASPIFLPCYCLMMENADDVFVTGAKGNMYQEQGEAYDKLFSENETVYVAFQKDCLQSKEEQTAQKEEFESFMTDSESEADEAGEAEEAEPVSLTELSDGEQEMLQFFEENYDCTAEYCTIENTHFTPYRVMLYKLTKN